MQELMKANSFLHRRGFNPSNRLQPTRAEAKVAVQTDAKRRMHAVQGTICSKAEGSTHR